MIKYTVNTETFEFNPTKHATAELAFHAYDDHSNKIVATLDTIEKARKALDSIKVSTYRFGYKVAQATVAYIEEAEFDLDEDGELEYVQGGDILDFKFEALPNDDEDGEDEE
ncbi:MAG: hypothetical protein IJ344_01135 [Clostridia bacterium]|nr:hypothetical protein [Clostridia bacterium]